MYYPLRNILLLILLLLMACQTRYAYRSKVRVGKNEASILKPETGRSKSLSVESNKDESDEWLATSADSSANYAIPGYQLKKPSQKHETIRSDSKLKSHKPFNLLRKESVAREKAPLNYYAKWAWILALISLTTFPLILPVLLGPVDIATGIIALIQIKKTKERGKGRAVFAIILGLLLTAILIFILLVETVIEPYSRSMALLVLLIALGVLLLNYFILYLLQNGKNNPANKELFQDRKPLDPDVMSLYHTTMIFAILTVLGSFFLLPLSFSPLVWILSARTLKRMPKESKSNRRIVMRLFYFLGILGTIAMLIFMFYFILYPNYFGLLIAMILLGLTVIFTLAALLILSANSKRRSEENITAKKGSINGLSKFAFVSGLIAIASIFITPLSAFSVFAIVTALRSLYENRVTREQGSEMAIAGLVLGLVVLTITFLLAAFAYKEIWSKLFLLGLLLGLIISPIILKIHSNKKIRRDFQKNGRR